MNLTGFIRKLIKKPYFRAHSSNTMLKNLTVAALLLCTITTLAQNAPVSATDNSPAKGLFRQKDTPYWIDNFRQLRDAIYQKNIGKSKAFFQFPVAYAGNEIWYVATPGQTVSTDNIKPFTDKDLTKYFRSLFPKGFTKALLKVKTEELFKNGEHTTPAIIEGNTEYILYSTYDKAEHMLQLNLASKFNLNNEDDEVGEYNIIYYFTVTEKGHLIFSHISTAG